MRYKYKWLSSFSHKYLNYCQVWQHNHKQLWKFLVIILFIGFFIVYWKEILIFTNYEVIGYKISHLSHQSKQNLRLTSIPKNYFNIIEKNSDLPINKPSQLNFEKNYLEIPKIKIVAPIISQKKIDAKKIKQQLKKQGVLLYPGGILGKPGKTIILGHSTYAGWPDINYSNIFNKLNQLENKDEIIVYYNQKKYIYKVFDKKIFLPKDEKQALLLSAENKNQSVLILLTCWPLGKDDKRLAIITKLTK